MPFVNVRIIRGDVTAEHKSQAVAKITQTLRLPRHRGIAPAAAGNDGGP
jgi:hypothetical protein